MTARHQVGFSFVLYKLAAALIFLMSKVVRPQLNGYAKKAVPGTYG
jgi:hypothetical protein